MIFVTVGTASFDALIMEMDRLVAEGVIREEVVAQIGRGQYIPQHIRHFRFIRSLNKAYEVADMIVSAGGAGTMMECVRRGLRLVVVENSGLMEAHQSQLIGELARRGHLVWCRSLANLSQSIEEARRRSFVPFKSDPPTRMIEMICSLLQ